jgi:hypothetical protein
MRWCFVLLSLLIICTALTLAASAQTPCLDLADEPHHQLLYSNSEVRVFLLELPRLASTEPHCHNHPFFYVVPGEGRSSVTPDGQATWSSDWHGGETRFLYAPVKHVTRNEGINPYREVVVESLRQVQYQPLDRDSSDLLAGELDSAKPTWTYSVVRGPLAASKTQLAPGADMAPSGAGQVLIALTDLDLKRERDGLPAQSISLQAQEVLVLTGGTLRLLNAGAHSAKFITVEF